MVSLFYTLKNNSKQALRGNRVRACVVLLIRLGAGLLWALMALAATFVFGEGEHLYVMLGIQGVAALFTVFLLTPLSLGILSWYIGVVSAHVSSVSAVFVFFGGLRRYLRAVWYSINMTVRTLFWAIVFYALPMATLAGVLVFTQMYGAGAGRHFAIISAYGFILAGLLIILATVLYSAYMTKYFLVAYLLAGDKGISVRSAFKQSREMTAGHRFSILLYGLSFIGWALLTVLFLPVIFYTAPIIKTSLAMYAHYLIEKEREYAQRFSLDDTDDIITHGGEMTQEFAPAENNWGYAASHPSEQPTMRIDPADTGAELEWQDAPPWPLSEESPPLAEPKPPANPPSPFPENNNYPASPHVTQKNHRVNTNRWPYI